MFSLFSTCKWGNFLNLGPWFVRKNLKKKRIQISERMKYIIYNLASVPFLPLLILTRTIYYVILLLYKRVERIIPKMKHVSFKYN